TDTLLVRSDNFDRMLVIFRFFIRARWSLFLRRNSGLYVLPVLFLFSQYFYAGPDRLCDTTTWAFIKCYEELLLIWDTLPDVAVVAEFMLYNVFTGAPQPYGPELTATFRGCYNQRNRADFPKILQACREGGVFFRLGEHITKIMDASTSVPWLLGSMAQIEAALLGVKGIGAFNAKEFLWHIILLHEARTNAHSPLREYFVGKSLFGNGACDGLRIFYPLLTASRIDDAARDLYSALEDLGIWLPCMHSLQWKLCLFQKSLNACYTRPAPGDRSMVKEPSRVKIWAQLLRHPHWPSLRREILSYGLGNELCHFEHSIEVLQNVPRHLPGHVTCRTCLGLSTKSHGSWQAHYTCYRLIQDARATSRQRPLTQFFRVAPSEAPV
ncbi:unnamed protein product, partial [Prorocentrum cordatum]